MKHDLSSVVIVSWQQSEHGNISLRYETCSVMCNRLMTTVRARWNIHQVWNMLRQLSSSYGNGQSMVIYHPCMKHAQTVVIISWQRKELGYSSLRFATCSFVFIVSWQRSKHGNISIMYESCSVSCHHLMTTVRAWLYIIYLLNMPCKLSSANDNGHNMVMYSSGIKHAPSVVIVSWQRTKHCYSSLRYEHAPSVVIVSRQRSEHGYISLRY